MFLCRARGDRVIGIANVIVSGGVVATLVKAGVRVMVGGRQV